MVEPITDREFDDMWNRCSPIDVDTLYSKHILSSRVSVALHYADCCHFSQKIIPEWNKFRKYANLHFPSVTIYEVNGKIPSDVKIIGYPTIVLRKGDKITLLQGYSPLSDIINFVKAQL